MLTYQKRKNQELFQTLERNDLTFLSDTQNYIPIYKRFFSLNESNYNSINLNHKWFLSNIREKVALEHESDDDSTHSAKDEECGDEQECEFLNNVYLCTLKNSHTNKTKVKHAFLKRAPLLDPYKYLIGKYNANDPKLFQLPTLSEDVGHPTFHDPNNAAYVDGLFCFLSSQLLHNHGLVHGVDYYGSFLAIQNNFSLNIYDDLEYLHQSEYFIKNINVLFQVEDYSYLMNELEKQETKLPALHIDQTKTCHSVLSACSIDEEMFGNVFSDSHPAYLSLQDVKTKEELEDITHCVPITHPEQKASIKSNSTCSSRLSYTTLDNEKERKDTSSVTSSSWEEDVCEEVEEGEGEEADDDDSEDDDEFIEAVIPKFPVQVICMEQCENTLDDLLLHEDISEEELFSALMQVIMTLCTYQKVFSFTHNDLHTNNIMYIETDKKFLYYVYKKKYYKVPTYGKIYKIIDYGRGIFKLDGKLFCSNSFQQGNDASTQYNTEPYFNDKKPRLEPNFSFDLTRLACSIFDYVMDQEEHFESVKHLIEAWCQDDHGINLLYKANGEDRYPQFKLYKMIARCVHKHTPQNQLERPEFSRYQISKSQITEKEKPFNLDDLPLYL